MYISQEEILIQTNNLLKSPAHMLTSSFHMLNF